MTKAIGPAVQTVACHAHEHVMVSQTLRGGQQDDLMGLHLSKPPLAQEQLLCPEDEAREYAVGCRAHVLSTPMVRPPAPTSCVLCVLLPSACSLARLRLPL